MTQELWTAVDGYIRDLLIPSDPDLDAALEASTAAGLPSINVSPPQGKFLHLLARMHGARRILEIGTLGGYSTIWLARALPTNGRLITLEIDPRHAEVARGNFARAGVSEVIELRLGPAGQTLTRLVEEGQRFDMIFIDADKESTTEYFDSALQLSHPGTVIIVDNVVRDGDVIDAASEDSRVQGIRRFYQRLSAEPSVSATVVQTVGTKGHDGFALAVVR